MCALFISGETLLKSQRVVLIVGHQGGSVYLCQNSHHFWGKENMISFPEGGQHSMCSLWDLRQDLANPGARLGRLESAFPISTDFQGFPHHPRLEIRQVTLLISVGGLTNPGLQLEAKTSNSMSGVCWGPRHLDSNPYSGTLRVPAPSSLISLAPVTISWLVVLICRATASISGLSLLLEATSYCVSKIYLHIGLGRKLEMSQMWLSVLRRHMSQLEGLYRLYCLALHCSDKANKMACFYHSFSKYSLCNLLLT